MTVGGGRSLGGGPEGFVAASALAKLFAVTVKPTAAPPTPTTHFAHTSMNRSPTSL